MQLGLKAKFYQYLLQKHHDYGSTELLVLIFLSIIVLIAINLPSLLDCTSKSRASEGRTYANAMNRSQEAYLYDYDGNFAQSIQQLGIGIEEKTKEYTYSMKVTKEASFHYAVANPKRWFQPKPVTSFVGAVFVINSAKDSEIKTVSILCQNNIRGNIQPLNPTYKKGIATCHSGTRKIQ